MEEETPEQREMRLVMLRDKNRTVMSHQGTGLANYFASASVNMSRKYAEFVPCEIVVFK